METADLLGLLPSRGGLLESRLRSATDKRKEYA